jgi:hypothetical protein
LIAQTDKKTTSEGVDDEWAFFKVISCGHVNVHKEVLRGEQTVGICLAELNTREYLYIGKNFIAVTGRCAVLGMGRYSGKEQNGE